MEAPRCLIRIQRTDRNVILRVEGRAAMNQSPAVRRFAEQCGAGRLCFDLRHCSYMDSTFLGTLLILKRSFDRKGQVEFALISPSEECRQLLDQMGLLELLPILEDVEPAEDSWTLLPETTEDAGAFKQNIVWAHQELGKLDNPMGKRFQAVAACLESEMQAERAQ